MIVIPEVIKSVFVRPVNEPINFGIVGSVYLAFGILSIFGLRSPLKFVPILLLQLCYKSIWLIGVVLPLLVTGRFPNYAILNTVIFVTVVVGDLIAIPFFIRLCKTIRSVDLTPHTSAYVQPGGKLRQTT